jgi:hypothetical protein
VTTRQSRFDFAPTDWDAFMAYHEANPHIYEALRLFALEAVRAGRTHLGINMLHERVRWYTNIESNREPWKLNNNYRPYYARLLAESERELRGLFETRTAKADDHDAA